MEDIMPETEVEEDVKKRAFEKVEEKKEERESDKIHDKDEEKRGGIINHFISNLVSPMSSKAGVFASQNDEDCCDGDLERSGGGVMNNLITNLFHHSEEAHAKQSKEESLEKKKKEEKEEDNGKGGIIDSIVSHFPSSIPEDAVPTTDEASILINSIVKD